MFLNRTVNARPTKTLQKVRAVTVHGERTVGQDDLKLWEDLLLYMEIHAHFILINECSVACKLLS